MLGVRVRVRVRVTVLGGAGYGAARNLTLTVLIHLLRLRTLRTWQARVLGRFYASKPKDGKDGSLRGLRPTRRICQLPSPRPWASRQNLRSPLLSM